MNTLNFVVLIGAVIFAAGLTVFTLMENVGSPVLGLFALCAALVGFILTRRSR